MRIFKNRWFANFAKKEAITDEALRDAIERAERGLIDANLGGGLIKQRLARAGAGRSGGYRAIIVFRAGYRAFVVFGFAKSRRENLDPDEEVAYKDIGRDLMAATSTEIRHMIAMGYLTEVQYDD
jgi:hypothetical protein